MRYLVTLHLVQVEGNYSQSKESITIDRFNDETEWLNLRDEIMLLVATIQGRRDPPPVQEA